MRFAAIFPGQGSQCVGMGCDVAAQAPQARELFARAAVVLGYDLLELQRAGPDERLRETQYSQPAIFTTNLALYAAAADGARPVVTAGHSFAELCGLVVGRAVSFEDALRIVRERGLAMQAAAQRSRGAMSAVLGLTAGQVSEVLARLRAERGGRITLANYNAPTQIVISGDLDMVLGAAQPMLDAGAKRVVPLNVSGAWHSELMESALKPLAAAVARSRFTLPEIDVISNVDGRPYRDVATIERNVIRSVVDEVRWHDAARSLLRYDLDAIVEFGASNVLAALVRRMEELRHGASPSVGAVSDWAGVEKFRARQADAASAAV